MFLRIAGGAVVLAAALVGLPLAAAASDGGMGGGGVPTPRGPAYDPNKEFHAGVDALAAGKYRAAKQNFEHVLNMVPDQPVALSMLGQAEAGLGDLKGAARSYEASLHVDAHQIIPARELAITDEKLGRHDKALSQLQKLQQRVDDCHDACAEAGDLAAAVRDIQSALLATSSTQSAQTPAAKAPAS